MKIALLSSFNADLLPSWLSRALQKRALEADFYVSGFDQYRQEILDPDSGLYRAQPDAVLLLLDGQDLFANLLQHPFDYTREQREALLEEELANLRHYSETIHARLPKASLFLNTLTIPPLTTLGLLEYNSPYTLRSLPARYNSELSALTLQMAHTYVVDCEALALQMGWTEWSDERLWLLGRMRLSRRGLEALAERYAQAICAVYKAPRKVLALDGDQTLWGGLIGTDGLLGIQLGYEGTGLAYRQFQNEILNLSRRGVLLALVSKNNPDDIDAVLDQHPAMLLRREHFAALCVNWEDKATNLRQIAAQFNLGLESFVFVDDSAFECAWVQDQLPEVQVLHLPSDPATYVQALRELDAFNTLTLTAEDLTRGKLYREELQRKVFRQTARSLDEFLASLQMRALIRPVDAQTLARAAQLTQKTNQFHLTGRRYSEAELKTLAAQPNKRVYTLSLSDRFGDNGLVGVAILVREEEAARIDTFLLSCRVIGRKVETALLAFLAEQALADGARYLLGEFVPSAKNMPARQMYRQHGFAPLDADGLRWRCALPAPHLRVPDAITLESPEEAEYA